MFTRFDSAKYGVAGAEVDLPNLLGGSIQAGTTVTDHRNASTHKVKDITYTATNRYTVTLRTSAPLSLEPNNGYGSLVVTRKALAGGKGGTTGDALNRTFARAALRSDPDEDLTIDGDTVYTYTFDALEDAA
jgi:hypothetical protein